MSNNVFFEAVLEAPVLGTLKNFEKIPWVWAVWCGVVCGDFENFQSFPVCGPCVVVCEDFENFQSFPVCGPCAVWRL